MSPIAPSPSVVSWLPLELDDSWDDPVIEIPEDLPNIRSGKEIVEEAKKETLPETILQSFLTQEF